MSVETIWTDCAYPAAIRGMEYVTGLDSNSWAETLTEDGGSTTDREKSSPTIGSRAKVFLLHYVSRSNPVTQDTHA